jgi:hypothetical protein
MVRIRKIQMELSDPADDAPRLASLHVRRWSAQTRPARFVNFGWVSKNA